MGEVMGGAKVGGDGLNMDSTLLEKEPCARDCENIPRWHFLTSVLDLRRGKK